MTTVTDDDLLPPLCPAESLSSTVMGDYWWSSGYAKAAATVPITWLSGRLSLRLQKPYNYAEVSWSGATARAENASSVAFVHARYPFTATLATDVDADPPNLAHFMVTMYSAARMRATSLEFDLTTRTDTDRRYLLSIPIGRHVQITGVPAEFPAGADHVVVVGIHHDISIGRRRLRWTCDPLVGVNAGTSGPWFRWGASSYGGADTRTF